MENMDKNDPVGNGERNQTSNKKLRKARQAGRQGILREKSRMEIFHEFASETTLQGIYEISKYWTVWQLRLFFVLLQIACLSAMGYHMYLVMSQFLASPVLIQTVTTNQRSYKYPSMTFCPQLWLNVTRYNEMQVPKPAFLYAISLMKRVTINEPVNVTKAKQELEQFMDQNNISTYYEFYTMLANDFTNESLFCLECNSWPPKKILTEEGICYHFTFNDWVPNILVTCQPKLAYNPVHYENTTIYNSFQTVGFSEYVAIGSHRNDFLALDPIFMVQNHSFFLRVTPTKHTNLDDDATPCVENETLSTLMCKAYCRQDARDRLCKLPRVLGYFKGSHNVGPHTKDANLWSSLTSNVEQYYNQVEDCHQKIDNDLVKCDDDVCQPWCHDMTYTTSVQTVTERRVLQEMPEAAISIIMSYNVRAGIVEVVETYSYTWYSFLSDVGGLIGLWCGASVSSVIPIFVFFGFESVASYRIKRKKKRVEKKKNLANGTLKSISSTVAIKDQTANRKNQGLGKEKDKKDTTVVTNRG